MKAAQSQITNVLLALVLLTGLAIVLMLATGVRLPGTPIGQPSPGGFPIVISQPGHYYLTGNIQGEPDTNGIAIASNDVTLDLMGFAMKGSISNPNAGGSAVVSSGEYRSIVIRNGTMDGWTSCGIAGPQFGDSLFEDLRIVGSRCGIEMGGASIARRVQVSRLNGNSGYGIKMYDTPGTRLGGIVEDSVITEVAGPGIIANADALIRRNFIYLTNLSNTPGQAGILMQGFNITVADNVGRWSLQADINTGTASNGGVVVHNLWCSSAGTSPGVLWQNPVVQHFYPGTHWEYDTVPDANIFGTCS